VFHFPPSELDAMAIDELIEWHRQAKRIMQLVNPQ
jgi:hypothetical protein